MRKQVEARAATPVRAQTMKQSVMLAAHSSNLEPSKGGETHDVV